MATPVAATVIAKAIDYIKDITISIYTLKFYINEVIKELKYNNLRVYVGFYLLGDRMKRCSKCKKEKLLSEFCKNKNVISGLNSWCKNCCNKYQQEYQESEREYKQRYQSQIKASRSLSVGLSDSLAYCEACFEE